MATTKTRVRRNPSQADLRSRCAALIQSLAEIRSAAPKDYYALVDFVMSDTQLAQVVWGGAYERIVSDTLDTTPSSDLQKDKVLPLFYQRLSEVDVLLGIWDLYSARVLANIKLNPLHDLLLQWAVRTINRMGVHETTGELVLISPQVRDTPTIIPKYMTQIGAGNNLVSTLLSGLYYQKSGDVIRKAIVEAS